MGVTHDLIRKLNTVGEKGGEVAFCELLLLRFVGLKGLIALRDLNRKASDVEIEVRIVLC